MNIMDTMDTMNITEVDDDIDYTQAYSLDTECIVNICESTYPEIINDLLRYIELNRLDEPLVETIVQYSFDRKIDLMLIGDAIKDDEYFKMYIERDSEHHNLLKSDKQEDW